MHSNVQAIKQQLRDSQAIELCAQQCGTIGSPTTLKICYLLRHYPELNVTTIAELVGTSVSNASHSLNRLRAVRLVSSRRCGQTICYSLVDDAFRNVISVISG
ncbi:MAG: metalloregulator ArsR/SmtB family transcription factor [Candidatus Saccharimonadales bacterium]